MKKLTLCPDPALSRGKGLVTIERFLGCSELAVSILNKLMEQHVIQAFMLAKEIVLHLKEVQCNL